MTPTNYFPIPVGSRIYGVKRTLIGFVTSSEYVGHTRLKVHNPKNGNECKISLFHGDVKELKPTSKGVPRYRITAMAEPI